MTASSLPSAPPRSVAHRVRRPLRAAAIVTVSALTVLAAGCSGDSDARGAAGTDDRNGSSSDAARDGSEAVDCATPRPFEASEAPRTFSFDGEERSYLISVPDDYDGRSARPLVFDFHGWSGSKEGHGANTALGARGSDRGFIVVTPDALGAIREWNMFDTPGRARDYAFVHALLADLTAQLCIDADRVYAAGHSNGSAFTGFLACKPPFELAAVAMVSATVPSTCPEEATPSVLAIAGTADPAVPYAGGSVGGGATGIPPTKDTMRAYQEHYGCDPEPERTTPHPGVEREQFTGCRNRSEAVLDTVVGGGHPWPGTPAARRDRSNSEAGRTYDATDAVLTFFESHRRRPPTAPAAADAR